MNTRRASIFWAITISLPILVLMAGLEIAGYWSLPHWRFPYDAGRVTAYDAELGFVARPHLRVKWGEFVGETPIGYHVYTDRDGARVSTPGEETPAKPDILFIGCSFTWGDGVEYEETFAAELARKLRVPIANMSMFAYGTTQALQMLRRHRNLAPKLIIYPMIGDHLRRNVATCAPSFYPFCLDVSHVVWHEGKPTIAPPNSDGVNRLDIQVRGEIQWLDPLTWVLHRLDTIYGRITWALTRSAETDKARQEAALEFLLGEMARTTNELGSKLLVLYLPARRDNSPPDILAKTLAKLEVPLLDLSPPFREYEGGASGQMQLYLPNQHPSVRGHALIAHKLTSFIQAQTFLPRE